MHCFSRGETSAPPPTPGLKKPQVSHVTGPSRAGPSRAGPGPSRAGPYRTSRPVPGRTERAEPGRAKPGRAVPTPRAPSKCPSPFPPSGVGRGQVGAVEGKVVLKIKYFPSLARKGGDTGTCGGAGGIWVCMGAPLVTKTRTYTVLNQ